MTPLLVACAALHVDAPDEPGARAILARFLVAAGLDIAPRIRWELYTKLGEHSRLTFHPVLRDCPDAATAMARLDAVCAVLVTQECLAACAPTTWVNDDGTVQYGRVLSANVDDFRFAGAHWFDVEINTYGPAQEDARRAAGLAIPG